MVNRNPRQVILSTTALSLVKEDQNRTSLTLSNLDASITMYYGYSNDISTTAKSFPLVAGETITILLALGEDPRYELFILAASGTPTVAVKEDGGEELMRIVKGRLLVSERT